MLESWKARILVAEKSESYDALFVSFAALYGDYFIE